MDLSNIASRSHSIPEAILAVTVIVLLMLALGIPLDVEKSNLN